MNTSIIIMILSISISILALIALYLTIKAIKSKKLEPKIIELITEAEGKFTNGNIKFEYVFDELYNKFAPSIIRFLFSAQEIRNLIQYVFDKIKIALDYKGE